MNLTKKQTNEILELFKMVDVRDMEIDGVDEEKEKWFRFGSYNGLQVAIEIVKALEEKKVTKIKVV